jgi:predicted enzyme related to lactoylglutathione lyase
MEGMRGRTKTDWWGVVLEAPDAAALARFYSQLLGWPIARAGPGGAAIQVPGTSSYLGFDHSPDYEPPLWPADGLHQRQQMHLDIAVDDLDASVTDAVELGARLADFQPQDDVRVMLDPAGHPFCLYLDTEE